MRKKEEIGRKERKIGDGREMKDRREYCKIRN
jgi:hypothetical protein